MMQQQEKFTKLVDEFVDECNLPIYSQAKGNEPELIDETSVEDRFEVYRIKLQNALQNKKAYDGNDTLLGEKSTSIDKYNSPRTRENLLLKENYKNYKIYQTESPASSKSHGDDNVHNIEQFNDSENQEELESDNENNVEVKTLLQTSSQQIELINKLLVEQRQRKLHQFPQEDDNDDEATEYWSERMLKLANTARDKVEHSLQTQFDESIERDLWVSKSAHGRFGQDCSVISDCTRIPPSTFTIDKSEKQTHEFLDDESKISMVQGISQRTNPETNQETSQGTTTRNHQPYYHCRNKSLNEKSETRKPLTNSKTSESVKFEAGALNRGRDAGSAGQGNQREPMTRNQITSKDKLSIEDRLYLQELAREARLNRLREEKEKSIEAELKGKPEISKNSHAILMNSKKYKNQGDVYQRCLQFQHEKEMHQKSKQSEKIAEDLSQCTYQPEINEQSRRMNRQLDSLFEWNNKRLSRQNKMKEEKELQEIQEFESLQKKVLTCEGSKRILQQKGSRSQEPVEIRLLSQGARIERKINEIRNQQFQTLKQAAPKIDKKSARIMNEKIHGSFHQRLAKSMSANSRIAKSEFMSCEEFERPKISTFEPVEDHEREQFLLESKGSSLILGPQFSQRTGSGKTLKPQRGTEAQVIARKIIEEKLMQSDILSDFCEKSAAENQSKNNQKSSNDLVQGDSILSCLREQYEELSKLSNQGYGNKKSQHQLPSKKQNVTSKAKKQKNGGQALEEKKTVHPNKDSFKDQAEKIKASHTSSEEPIAQAEASKKPVSNYLKIMNSYQNAAKVEKKKKEKQIHEISELDDNKPTLNNRAKKDTHAQLPKKTSTASQKQLKPKTVQSKAKPSENKSEPAKENKYKFHAVKPQTKEKEMPLAEINNNARGRQQAQTNFFSETRNHTAEEVRTESSLDMKNLYFTQRLTLGLKDTKVTESNSLLDTKSLESRTHSVDQGLTKASPASFLNSLKLRQNKIFARGKDDQLIILDRDDSINNAQHSTSCLEQASVQSTKPTRKLKPEELELFTKRNEAWLSSRNAKIDAMIESKERSELEGCTFKPFIYTKEVDLSSILQKPQFQLHLDSRSSHRQLHDQTNSFSQDPLQMIESNKSPSYLRNFAVKKLGLSNFATPKNSDRSAFDKSAKENSTQQMIKKPDPLGFSPLEQCNFNSMILSQANRNNFR